MRSRSPFTHSLAPATETQNSLGVSPTDARYRSPAHKRRRFGAWNRYTNADSAMESSSNGPCLAPRMTDVSPFHPMLVIHSRRSIRRDARTPNETKALAVSYQIALRWTPNGRLF